MPLRDPAKSLSDRLAVSDRHEARDVLRSFASTLPRPESEVESLFLRSLLFEVAVRTVVILHGRLHSGASNSCGFQTERLLDIWIAWAPGTVDATFEVWQDALWKALDAAHPSTLGSSIGCLVRRDPKERWSLVR